MIFVWLCLSYFQSGLLLETWLLPGIDSGITMMPLCNFQSVIARNVTKIGIKDMWAVVRSISRVKFRVGKEHTFVKVHLLITLDYMNFLLDQTNCLIGEVNQKMSLDFQKYILPALERLPDQNLR